MGQTGLYFRGTRTHRPLHDNRQTHTDAKSMKTEINSATLTCALPERDCGPIVSTLCVA